MRSSASSSANRMVIGLGVGDIGRFSFWLGLVRGQRHDESRSLVLPTACGDRPPVTLGDFPANREPDSSSLVRAPAVQPLKNVENPIEIFLVEPDPVVGDANF